MNGMWFMIATNEPTLPSICVCGVNQIDVHPNTNGTVGGWYHYTNHDLCGTSSHRFPFTVNIKGLLSNDTSTPGELHEQAEIDGHYLGKLDPNYMFHIEREANDGNITLIYSYACLGKLEPLGKPQFSFNILARSTHW